MSSKEAQDGSKEAEDSPEMSPGGLKMAPRRLKMDARWTQDGSKRPQEDHMLEQNGNRKEQSVCHMATQIENMVLSKVLKSFEFLPKKSDQEGPHGGKVASLER